MSETERYIWLFQKSPVMAALFDANGFFVDVSDALCSRLGFSRESLIGQAPVDIASEASGRQLLDELLPKLRRIGHVRNQPIEFVTHAGELVEMLASAVTEHDTVGSTIRTMAVYMEVHDKSRIERKYRKLYRETPAMLHTVDENGLITAVSNHWLTKLGYTDRKEVLGRPIYEFFTPEYSEQISKIDFREIILSGGLINVERQMVRRDGAVLDVVVSSINESHAGNGPPRLLVASKDVTDRNRAERALRVALAENAQLREELEHERDYLREEINVSMNFGRIVGTSPALKKMLERMQAVAQTPASVLILGESGVGKELIAHALHSQSPRASEPLVKVNCASIPKELFESEFFGHVKGAFTGAVKDRVGRFQLADGGTLFLDEVGEIPIELQGKLLRVLQEQEFERVGEDSTRRVDVRVIAATNRDLEEEVEAGRFREDLYYRLSVFPIEAPPLRKRGDDVVQLASHFLERTCLDFGHEPMQLTQANIDAIRAYDWPGNVRELKNVIERAVILSKGKLLRLDLSLPEHESTNLAEVISENPEPVSTIKRGFLTEQEMRQQQVENTLAALEAADWRVSGANGAAALLGVKPSTLSDRIRSMGLERPSRRRRAS